MSRMVISKDGCVPLAVEASGSSVQIFVTLIQQEVARLYHDFISSVAKKMSVVPGEQSMCLNEEHSISLGILRVCR